MEEEKPNRVFINQSGLLYSAPAPMNANDAECTFPTPDMITVLDREKAPITRDVMIGKIYELGNARLNATLAPSTPTEEKNA